MIRKKVKSNSEREYDTFSITMELERPLLYSDEKNIDNDKTKISKSKSKKKTLIATMSLLIIFIIGFFIWLSNGYALENNYMEYMNSNSSVNVTNKGEYTYFTPKNVDATKGFIFYPGERIDSSSYAKLCNMIASHGYKVVSVDMPFNYAAFGKNKAEEIISENPDISKWVIGGDSLGGTVASNYVVDNRNIDGMVFISSYPEKDMRDLGVKVLSIWGSKDDIIDYKKLINSKDQLPLDSKYVEIEGANHSQFANYGTYKGDEDALISNDEQMEITVNNIVEFLNNI